MRRRAAAGFTLLELLVVLLIVGLIASFVPLAFRNLLPDLSVKSAARALAADLRSARSLAIDRNRSTAVDLREGTVVTRNGDLTTEHELSDEFDVQFTADGDRGRVRGGLLFYPDGSSNGGRFVVADETRAYLVIVEWLTGDVRVLER